MTTPGTGPVTGPVTSPVRLATDLERVRGLARLLDNAVRVPGTRIGVGLDSVIGLIPGLGDFAGAAMSTYVVLTAARMGVPRPVLARMLLNVGIDALVGAVPVIGDLFDVAWKANTRNVALMEDAVAMPDATRRSSVGVVAGVSVVLLLVLGAGIALAIVVAKLLVDALGL